MARLDYSRRDHVGTRITNVADPVLRPDVMTKGYFDDLSVYIALEQASRISATSTTFTVPNNSQQTITNWTQSVARDCTYSAGYFAAGPAGVYGFSVSGAFNTGIPSGVRAFLSIVVINGGHYFLSNFGPTETIGTATGIVGLGAGESVVASIYQNSGTARTWGGLFNMVRLSAL